MKTVILYNIISLIIIFVLIFVLRIVSKSDLRKNQQLIIKVITTILGDGGKQPADRMIANRRPQTEPWRSLRLRQTGQHSGVNRS